MDGTVSKSQTVDEYISQETRPEVQEILRQVRAVIRAAAPDAEERISYGIPGYYQKGQVVFFSAAKHHIGLYPRTEAMNEAFKDEILPYAASKGTLQFKLKDAIPYDLIERIVRFRVAENLAKKK